MNEYNILILCVGRRVELVQRFRKAAQRLNVKSTIVGGDSSELAPALYFTDKKVIFPPIDNPHYIDYIIEICNHEKIALVIPTIDTDLLILSENKEKIESKTRAKVIISEKSVIEICRDKALTQKYFDEHGLKIAKMYRDEEIKQKNKSEIHFPLFAKPRSGSSSINTMKINTYEELIAYKALVSDVIITDFSDGEEFTVDTFLDFESNVITIVPRLRMAIRGGEIMKAKIVKDREIINDIKRLLTKLKFIGHITIQLIRTKNGIEYFEINPRYGGGAPMGIDCGADSCENLFRLLMGEKLEYNEKYRDNIYFIRFDDSICLDENMELVKW